ncbi:hypothetical protein scyTo_0003850 [Scyliorhinus torazame]|uniref:Chemokine interleukin-8-like domain-containing protein n=1 Tax=Scyliorhinus torazame TaxID=75743 RepID=A0A401PNS4_SCYTO|nr:hypothetical protein [Scyliorhinus torazame]
MNTATTAMILTLLLCAITAQEFTFHGFVFKTPPFVHSVTKVTGEKVCVSPDAQWVKIIIKAKKGAKPGNQVLKPQ